MFPVLTCVGTDNILHHCEPNSDVCLCGMKVKQKINVVTPQIIERYRFWCCECDYTADDYFEDEEKEEQ